MDYTSNVLVVNHKMLWLTYKTVQKLARTDKPYCKTVHSEKVCTNKTTGTALEIPSAQHHNGWPQRWPIPISPVTSGNTTSAVGLRSPPTRRSSSVPVAGVPRASRSPRGGGRASGRELLLAAAPAPLQARRARASDKSKRCRSPNRW